MKKLILLVTMLCLVGLLCGTTIHIPQDEPLIQWGIDVAVEGDTILVAPGTYEENIEFEGKNVILASHFFTTQDSSYIQQTILDGDTDGSVVNVSGCSEPAMICGFTIVNGSGTYEPVVWMGGGIYVMESTVTICNNIITNNSAGKGAGIYARNSVVEILDNEIVENDMPTSRDFWGGGICCKDSYAEIRRCNISDNIARIAGGIMLWGSDFLIDECSINDNTVYCGGGGGLDIQYTNSGAVTNCVISGNATDFPSGSVGGGVYFNTANVSLYNVLIHSNTAEDGAGTFSENDCEINWYNCTISDNSADVNGGGIWSGSSVFQASSETFTNCIIYDNSPNQIHRDNASISFRNCDLEGGDGAISVGYGSTQWLEGNIDVCPMFIDQAVGDYRLQEDSPCIDAGLEDMSAINMPQCDLAGEDRIQDGDGDGISVIDMGCYESDAVSTHSDPSTLIASSAILRQNYPNPFNPSTTIRFELSKPEKIDLAVYNARGQKVKQLACDYLSAGQYSKNWNGDDELGKPVSSGIYYFKLQGKGISSQTRKCVLMK